LIGKIQTRYDFKIGAERIFLYLCELCWNFSLDIRREATKQLENIKVDREELVMKTIKKQSLSDYQKKDELIETTDLDFSKSRGNKKE
jgi:hypothetical protein